LAKRGRKSSVNQFQVLREDTWEKLQRAAAKSGRSVSQEFEFRLRRGLDEDERIESTFGDLKTYGLMKLAAQLWR
jgi:hypothetical protein